jgi:copper resistance protein C
MKLKFLSFLAASLLLLAPSGANAHDLLLDIDPAPGSVITETNPTFTLTFNNPLLVISGESNASLETKLAAGDWQSHEVLIEGPVLTSKVGLVESGTYELRWKVVSSDGHPITGESYFTVDLPDLGSENEPVLVTENPNPSEVENTGSMTGFYIGLAMVIAGVIFAPIGLIIRRRARNS